MAAQSRQIDLLFGVKGGGSVNGESGQRIQSQINGIVSGLKAAKIKVDYTAVLRAHKQLEQLSKQIDVLNGKKIKLTSGGNAIFNIKNSGGVLSEAETLYKQIQRISNGLPAAEARVAGFNQQLTQTKIVASDLTRVKSLIGPLLNKQGTLISFSGAKTHLDEMRNIVGAYGQYIKHVKAAATANQHHNLAIKNADANLRAMYSSLKSSVNSLGRNKTKLLNMDDTIPEVKQAKTLIASLEAEVVKFKTTAGTVKPINFFGNNLTNSNAMKAFLSSSDLQKLPAAMAAATKANTTYGKSVTSLEAQVKKVQKLINNFGSKKAKLFSLNKELAETKKYKQALIELQNLAKRFTVRGQVISAEKMDTQKIAALKQYLQLYDLLPAKIHAATAATHKLKLKTNEHLLASKALNQVWGSFYKMKGIDNFPGLKGEYLALMNELAGKTKLSALEASKYAARLKDLENRAFKTGAALRSFQQELDISLMQKVRSLIASFATTYVMQGFRILYRNVVEVDTAMTELKKVTEATKKEYIDFLDDAANRAKKLGASLTETINATADYARMGYSIKEASELADSAIVYQNVGDGLQDIDEATSHLISTMTAFGYAANDSMHIVDIFNEVANNYAVSAADIGTGLKKSAAAMASAGNSLEETVALFTAANTIAQDADTVGTALKTMSMRLRSTKTEMETAGEDTEGMAESVSSLRKEILALTGVDIQLDENTYKSSYQMLEELAAVWGELDDLTQANVLERLFGKRQANIGAGLLENFDIADKALKTAIGSEGSALEENEKYLESIQGHLDQLSASFQNFAQNFLNTELVKGVIDVLRGVLDFFNGLISVCEKLGGTFGQTIGSIVTLTTALTALDALWGFEHAKKAVAWFTKIINMTSAYNKKVSDWKAAVNWSKLSKDASKLDIGITKGITKIKTLITSTKFWGVAAAGAAAAAIVALGQWYEKAHSVESQLEEMNESMEEYTSAKDSANEYEIALQENINKLRELNQIPVKDRTKEQQAEIDKIKEENEALQTQIDYYKELAELKENEARQDILDGMDKVHGDRLVDYRGTFYTVQNRNVEYYSVEQAEYWKKQYEDYYNAYQTALTAGVGTGEGQYASKESWDTAVTVAKTKLDKVKTLYDDFANNVKATYSGLLEVTDFNDEEAVLELKELANMLKSLGLWEAGNTSGIIDAFKIDEFDKFEEIKKALNDTDGLVSQANLKRTFGTDVIDTLIIALEAAGVSWQEFIDYCNEAESESPVVVEVSTEELDAAKESVKSLSSSCKTLADAFKEQNENGSLSVDTILDVIDAGYGAALAVDAETGAVTLNADMYLVLAQAELAATKLKWLDIRASYEQQYAQAQEAISTGELGEAYKDLAEAELAALTAKGHLAEVDAILKSIDSIDLSNVTAGIYGIGDAASSVKSQLSSLQSGMESLLSQTISWLKDEYSRAQDAQEKYYDSQIDALEKAKDAAKERWDAEKEALEDAKDSYNDLIDAQIELLKRQKDADDYAKSREEKEEAISDIENQLLAIEGDDSIEAQKMRLELEEQLKEAQDELEELQSDREYELREQALQDEKDRYNDEIDAKLEAIEKQSEAEEKAYQERIDRLRDYLDAVRSAVRTEAEWRAEAYDWIENREEELYQQLLEWNRIYGDGRDATVEAWFKEAEGWRAWGDTFEEARNNLARYLQELEDGAGTVAQKTTTLLEDLLKQLDEYQQKLLEEGNTAEAKMVENLINNISNAVRHGMKFSEEMLQAMHEAVESGDKECLEATNRMLGYYNDVMLTGRTNFGAMEAFFRQAMLQMDEDACIILQGIYDNINAVAKAAYDMQTVLKSTSPVGSPGSIDTHLKELTPYSEGGVVDYTGPAKVHGSHANPEIVFNAEQAAKLYDYVVNTPNLLKSAFDSIMVESPKLRADPIGMNPTVGDININISGNADADTVNSFRKIAGQIREEVVRSLNESMSRRGIARSPRMV